MQLRIFHLLLFFLFAQNGVTQTPQKLALLVGVSEYAEGSKWANLHAENDLELIRASLIKQNFKEKNIRILHNQEANKAGIQKAFQEHLTNQVKPGDIVYFHFSGHGQQVADVDGDEMDGYDEALVPFDSPQSFEQGTYEGERLLSDDELGQWLHQLRQKLGAEGQVLITLDACHSGTATRGFALARGTLQKMASTTHQEKFTQGSSEQRQLYQRPSTASDLAAMVAIFASSAQELNYEYVDEKGQAYGSLSYAFSKAFADIKPSTTYKGLFDQLRKNMLAISPMQTPQIEGDVALQVFSGLIQPVPAHFNIIRALNEQSLLLDAGTLANLHPGTTLNLYPIGTSDTAHTEAIGTAVVRNTLPLISELQLQMPVKQSETMGAWAFVEKQAYGNLKIRVATELKHPELKELLSKELEDYSILALQGAYPDLIIQETGDDRIQLVTKEGLVLLEEAIDYQNLSLPTIQVRQRILKYAQAIFLRSLEMENYFLNLELELIPVEVQEVGGEPKVVKELPIAQYVGEDGIVRFEEEESFILKVTNHAQQAAYYTILDIWADNQIVSLIPNSDCGSNVSDYYIEAGETQVLDDCIIDLYPPFGNEMLKLIATSQPLQMDRVIRGERISLSTQNPFEYFFQFSLQKKRATPPTIPPSAAQVQSVVFKIVPKSK